MARRKINIGHPLKTTTTGGNRSQHDEYNNTPAPDLNRHIRCLFFFFFFFPFFLFFPFLFFFDNHSISRIHQASTREQEPDDKAKSERLVLRPRVASQDADIGNPSEAPAHDEHPQRPPLPVKSEGQDGEPCGDVPARGGRPHQEHFFGRVRDAEVGRDWKRKLFILAKLAFLEMAVCGGRLE